MSDVVRPLSPAFTDEEQLPAKQMQTGYKAVRDRMQAHVSGGGFARPPPTQCCSPIKM